MEVKLLCCWVHILYGSLTWKNPLYLFGMPYFIGEKTSSSQPLEKFVMQNVSCIKKKGRKPSCSSIWQTCLHDQLQMPYFAVPASVLPLYIWVQMICLGKPHCFQPRSAIAIKQPYRCRRWQSVGWLFRPNKLHNETILAILVMWFESKHTWHCNKLHV